MRFIFQAGTIQPADRLFNDLTNRVNLIKNSVTKIKFYEDDNHFEISFAVQISAKDITEFENKVFKLCINIAKGPWMFLKMPGKGIGNEFEAIFNPEAFIHHSTEYNNRLRWAHIEIT